MEGMQAWFERQFADGLIFGQSPMQWLIAAAILVATWVGLRVGVRFIALRLRKLTAHTRTDIDDAIVDLLDHVKTPVVFVLAVTAASTALTLTPGTRTFINTAAILAGLFQAGIFGNRMIVFLLMRYRKKRLEDDAASVTTMVAVGFISRVVVWSVVTLLILDNLGIDVTALVAGLGVGGIAVALAVQNVLGDLFASLSIVLDKPFVIGDFLVVGELAGTVQKIGLKTTRLTSLSGEQLIFANSDLLQSRIRNYKRMQERRIVFAFGVLYQTPASKLREIPGAVKEIIEADELLRFDRAHFKAFGDSSLDFEVVYYVLKPDYGIYMDCQQAINLAMVERFEQMGVDFAYPTRTIFIENGSSGDEAWTGNGSSDEERRVSTN